MIAADSSAWIDFLAGNASKEARLLEASLEEGRGVLPTPVFFELMSAPGIDVETISTLEKLPRLELHEGYWLRAAELRRAILRSGKRARSMDSLIAQNCMDHRIELITKDADFSVFVNHGLRLST